MMFPNPPFHFPSNSYLLAVSLRISFFFFFSLMIVDVIVVVVIVVVVWVRFTSNCITLDFVACWSAEDGVMSSSASSSVCDDAVEIVERVLRNNGESNRLRTFMILI